MSVASVNPWHSSSVGPLTIFAMVVCPSVHPSVRHKPVLYRNDWTNRAVWHGGFLPTILHCLVRKLQKNKNTSLWNFVPHSGLRKFRHGKSIVWPTKLCYLQTRLNPTQPMDGPNPSPTLGECRRDAHVLSLRIEYVVG